MSSKSPNLLKKFSIQKIRNSSWQFHVDFWQFLCYSQAAYQSVSLWSSLKFSQLQCQIDWFWVARSCFFSFLMRRTAIALLSHLTSHPISEIFEDQTLRISQTISKVLLYSRKQYTYPSFKEFLDNLLSVSSFISASSCSSSQLPGGIYALSLENTEPKYKLGSSVFFLLHFNILSSSLNSWNATILPSFLLT